MVNRLNPTTDMQIFSTLVGFMQIVQISCDRSVQQTFPADRYFLSAESLNESNGFEVFHNHSIVETIDGRDNTIIKTTTGFRYEITDLLYMNVSLDWDHESQPAGAAEKTDTTFVIGAGLEFD